jgi:hypothetical protein
MRRHIIGIAILLVLAAVGAYLGLRFEPKKTVDVQAPQNQFALIYEAAKKDAVLLLKAPGTAQFAPFEQAKITPTSVDTMWHVDAWVDSQNSFGALIRNRFSVEVMEMEQGRYAAVVASYHFSDWP